MGVNLFQAETFSCRIMKAENNQKLYINICFASLFFVTLQEFAGFLYIKAVWGIEEK